MNDLVQQFKETFQSAKSIAIRLSASFDIKELLAGAILHHALLSLEKKSTFQVQSIAPEVLSFLETFFTHTFDASPEENIVIKLDTTKSPIAELKYEKEGEILKIILQGNQALRTEDVRVDKEKVPVDLLVLIDPQESEVNTLLNVTPHRDVIKITHKGAGLAPKIFDIISSLFSVFPKEFSTPIWLLTEREQGENILPPRERVELQKRILEIGVDQDKVAQASGKLYQSQFWKFLGRALARGELEGELGVVWVFLPLADFQRTNQTPRSIPPIFNIVRMLRPEGNFFAVLWEEGSNTTDEAEAQAKRSVKALIGARDIRKLETLASLLGAHFSAPAFFLNSFPSFSEAELKIRAALRHLL